MKVVVFFRKPDKNNYSIENLFNTVREHFPAEIQDESTYCKFKSKGIIKRLYNIIEAPFKQGDINHITGDIHYICYLLKKRKTILTIHDITHFKRASNFKKVILKYFWYVIPEKRSEIITAISETTKNELIRSFNFNPNKIIVIFDCISKRFAYTPREFNSNRPRILQIGTKAKKNLFRLIEALRDIRCELDIVGQLSENQRMRLIKNKINYINSHNITEAEIIKKYINCDFITFISTSEGFGMPIIEANAVGRAVITSNISAMPEVAGDAAVFVDPFDVSSIRSGINLIINDEKLRTSLIRNGLKNANRFSADVIAKKYFEVYKALSSRNS